MPAGHATQGEPLDAPYVPEAQGEQTLSALGGEPAGHATQPHEEAEKPWPRGQGVQREEDAVLPLGMVVDQDGGELAGNAMVTMPRFALSCASLRRASKKEVVHNEDKEVTSSPNQTFVAVTGVRSSVRTRKPAAPQSHESETALVPPLPCTVTASPPLPATTEDCADSVAHRTPPPELLASRLPASVSRVCSWQPPQRASLNHMEVATARPPLCAMAESATE